MYTQGAISKHRFNLALPLVLVCALLLAACGFQLRGMTELSFKSLHLQGKTLTISKELKRALKNNGIKVIDTTEGAELLLEVLTENYEKRIQSLSGGGLVREYELNYRVTFRTREAAVPSWNEIQTIQYRRDFSYDDKALLGKAEEEEMLVNDMHQDAVRDILRHLSAIKPSAQ